MAVKPLKKVSTKGASKASEKSQSLYRHPAQEEHDAEDPTADPEEAPSPKTKSAKTAKPAKAVKEPKVKAGVSRRKGLTWGLGVHETWCRLFAENEEREEDKKWSDKAIYDFMCAEFPPGSAVYKKVQGVRTKYNRGGLSNGVIPEILSYRHDHPDDATFYGRRGRPRKEAEPESEQEQEEVAVVETKSPKAKGNPKAKVKAK